MSIDLFVANLLSPPVLFFLLGIIAVFVRSDLTIPDAIAKLFSLYLLWAIGFKGGVALRESGLTWGTLTPVVAAVGLSAIIPLYVFPLMRTRFNVDDACALAASYGSVSVVTFVATARFLEQNRIPYGGEMVAALALMEAPAIIVALVLRRKLDREPGDEEQSLPTLLHEALTSGPVFLLLGSLSVGLLTGPSGFEPLRAFSNDIFQGVLVLFLLEAGLSAGRRLKEQRALGLTAVGFGVAVPICNAVLGGAIAYLLGLSVGSTVLFTILAASASYIAVPAVMGLAIPRANAGLYLPMALGVTFPFNVCIGIPLYLTVIEALWPGSSG